MSVVLPVGTWKLLCDFCVVDWNLSPVLPHLEVAPVLNTEKVLSPRIDFSYEFYEGYGGIVDLVNTTSCCDELCGDGCSCNEPISLTWLVSRVQQLEVVGDGVVRNMLINIIYYPTNPMIFIDT